MPNSIQEAIFISAGSERSWILHMASRHENCRSCFVSIHSWRLDFFPMEQSPWRDCTVYFTDDFSGYVGLPKPYSSRFGVKAESLMELLVVSKVCTWIWEMPCSMNHGNTTLLLYNSSSRTFDAWINLWFTTCSIHIVSRLLLAWYHSLSC